MTRTDNLVGIVKALEARGLVVLLEEERERSGSRSGHALRVGAGGETLPVSISERTNQRPRVPKAGGNEYYPRHEFVPTGRLTLKVHSWLPNERSSWSDSKTQRLEDNLGNAVLGTEAIVAAVDAFRAKQRLEEQGHREHLRQQALEKDRLQCRAALTSDLRAMAAQWREAQAVREFLAAAAERVPESERSEESVAWLTWAMQEAEVLDPLHRTEDHRKATGARTRTVGFLNSKRGSSGHADRAASLRCQTPAYRVTLLKTLSPSVDVCYS